LSKKPEQDESDELAELVAKMVRASQGLNPKEKSFAGLMNIEDLKERTRVKTRQIIGRSFLRMMGLDGEEWSDCETLANLLDTYSISENGEQRKEAILYTSSRKEAESQIIALPTMATNQPIGQQKKGFFDRFRRNKGEGQQ